jgi:hypothetical protein
MEQHGEVPEDVSARLAALDDQPVEEHVAVYDELHRELRDQLVDGTAQGQGVDHDAPRPHP